MPNSSAKSVGIGCFWPTFLVFWFAVTAMLDGFILKQAAEQLDANERFLSVTATVLEARMDSSLHEQGVSYQAKVRYRYEVAGVSRVGDRISFGDSGGSDRSAAEARLAGLKKGESITVWYDPDEPSRSVLHKDFRHFPSLVPVLLIPLNCAGIALILTLRRSRRFDVGERLLAAVVETQGAQLAVLRTLPLDPSIVFLCCLGALGFVATFALAIPYGGFTVPIELVLTVSGGLVAAAIAISFAIRAVWNRRALRVTLDMGQRRLTVRGGVHELLGSSQERAIEIPFSDVSAVTIDSEPSGYLTHGPLYQHNVVLELEHEHEPARRLTVSRLLGPAGRSDVIAQWLRERLGLDDPSGVARP